jgi:hypothetical protein
MQTHCKIIGKFQSFAPLNSGRHLGNQKPSLICQKTFLLRNISDLNKITETKNFKNLRSCDRKISFSAILKTFEMNFPYFTCHIATHSSAVAAVRRNKDKNEKNS